MLIESVLNWENSKLSSGSATDGLFLGKTWNPHQ